MLCFVVKDYENGPLFFNTPLTEFWILKGGILNVDTNWLAEKWNQGVGNSAVEMSRQIRFCPIFLTNKKEEIGRSNFWYFHLFIKKKVGRLPKLANKILDATKNIKILIFFSKLDPFYQFHRLVLKTMDKNAESQLLFFLTASKHPKLSFRYHLPGCFAFAQIGKPDWLQKIWSTSIQMRMLIGWFFDDQIMIIWWSWKKVAT